MDHSEEKEIPDSSSQLLADERPNHLPLQEVKSRGDGDDEAKEKLMSDESNINSNKEASEVKFVSESQNGDAKINIGDVKLAFAGMGKEELMKFANDPFWIRLRWFLFVLFWLIWAGMLAGAIAIIVMAPKCAAPAPLKWWEQGPIYKVDVKNFKDNNELPDGIGDLKGLTSKLDYLKEIGVKGLIISSILKTSNSDDEELVDNFQEVDPVYGSIEDLKSLASIMKEKGLHLVMSFVPNHSSNTHPWFLESETNSSQYSNYYVWANGKNKNEPPNNWKSVYGGSAWTWSDKRQAFYLHQFRKDQPDLNFREPAVRNEFKNIFSFWIKNGVSGFQLGKVQYLLEDKGLRDESLWPNPGYTHDQYEFYSHKHTHGQDDIIDILSEWKEVIRNETSSEGILMVSGNRGFEEITLYHGDNANIIADIQPSTAFTKLKRGFSAGDLYEDLKKWLNKSNDIRPFWELSNDDIGHLASRFSSDMIDGLTMISMLLPGTPISYFGDEIALSNNEPTGRSVMLWDDTLNAGFSESTSVQPQFKVSQTVQAQLTSPESHVKLFKSLVRSREDASIQYGNYEMKVVNNGTVFALSRIKSGNPGTLVIFNPTYEYIDANVRSVKHMSEEAKVMLRSTNFSNEYIQLKSKVSTESIPLPAKSSLVLSFVPQMED